MNWQSVIGLEVHVQLATRSKLFSSASISFGAEPNAHACAVDMAMPGTLPVLNREVVHMAIRFGLAIHANIDRASVFARKHYFYPDLPKGYQISQYDRPIVAGGSLCIEVHGTTRSIAITRAHLEEDAGKSLHAHAPGMSAIDLNRAGTPLLEVVSEPVMYSPDEAVAYLKAMHRLVRYLGICDGDMSQGSMRCDANISLRQEGDSQFGTRVEIKNLNSFRFVHKALQHEQLRQRMLLESGKKVAQETRLYDVDKDATRAMRGKEEAQDYRYFPDPDLPDIVLSEEQIDAQRDRLPELPGARLERYIRDYQLRLADATGLVDERDCADYFDALIEAGARPQLAANWMLGEMTAMLKGEGFAACPVAPLQLALLLCMLEESRINGTTARQLLARLWEQPLLNLAAYVQEHGMSQVSDAGELEALVHKVVADNRPQVDQYRMAEPDKRKKLIGFFVGRAMQASQGKANPALVNQLLIRMLEG